MGDGRACIQGRVRCFRGLAAGAASVVSCRLPLMLLSAASISKSFAGVQALEGVSRSTCGRRGPRAGRRERRRQVDADQGHHRRPACRTRGRSRSRASRSRTSTRPARGAGDRGHLPAAGALPGPDGRREHRARRSSRAGRGGACAGASAPARARSAARRGSAPRSTPRRGRRDARRMPEQQLVEIARALGADARILIMDEPTASLSDNERSRTSSASIRELQGARRRHHLHLAPARRALRRRRSRDGPARRACWSGRGAWREVDRARPDPHDGRPRAVGRLSQAARSRRRGGPRSVRGLGCRPPASTTCRLAVRAGEILGLAGLVGAGRTELAGSLFGLTPADAGEIRVRGQAVADRLAGRTPSRWASPTSPRTAAATASILEMSVAANTTLATLRRRLAVRPARLRARAQRRRGASSSGSGIKTPSLEAPVGHLSGGNQQKVALARWLAAEPAVLILDEPTQGVDVGAKAEIHRLMASWPAGAWRS